MKFIYFRLKLTMDVYNIGIAAMLGAVGAAAGAISAVIVYTMCLKHSRLSPILGRGPLNWFEKDLLNRTKESQESSKAVFMNSKSNNNLDEEKNNSEQNDNNSDNEEWQFNYVCDTNESPKGESDNVSMSSVSSFIPPLPEGAVVALEKHMVIVKTPPNMSDAYSKLGNTKMDSISYHKMPSSISISSPDEGRGELDIGLMYDTSAGILTVRLIEARNLYARELSGTADPYAKVRLLPDQNNVWQTKIHRRTLNPVFDEDFVFDIVPESCLTAKTLEILLYDFDAFSRHYSMGYVQLHLSSVPDLSQTSFTLITKPILRYDSENEVKIPLQGELMVSLSYQISMEKLTVIIVRAKNLPNLKDSKHASLYVKVKIMRDGKGIKKKKSSVQHETISPVWNDIIDFDINSKLLSKCNIQFIILRANGELVAKCEVSNKCQRDLFYRVLAGKGASAQWLPLFVPEVYPGNCIKVNH